MPVTGRVVYDERVGIKELILVELEERTIAGFKKLVKKWGASGWKFEESRGFTTIKTRKDRIRWSIKIGLIPFERKAEECLLREMVVFREE